MASLNQRALLTVRANVLKTTADGLRDALELEAVVSHRTSYSPWGLTLEGRTNVFALETFKGGPVRASRRGQPARGTDVRCTPRAAGGRCLRRRRRQVARIGGRDAQQGRDLGARFQRAPARHCGARQSGQRRGQHPGSGGDGQGPLPASLSPCGQGTPGADRRALHGIGASGAIPTLGASSRPSACPSSLGSSCRSCVASVRWFDPAAGWCTPRAVSSGRRTPPSSRLSSAAMHGSSPSRQRGYFLQGSVPG